MDIPQQTFVLVSALLERTGKDEDAVHVAKLQDLVCYVLLGRITSADDPLYISFDTSVTYYFRFLVDCVLTCRTQVGAHWAQSGLVPLLGSTPSRGDVLRAVQDWSGGKAKTTLIPWTGSNGLHQLILTGV